MGEIMPRKIFTLALLALLPTLALAGEAEDRIRNLFVVRLDDPRVTVEVLGLPDSRFAVVLKGELEDARERNAVLWRAEEIARADVEIYSRLEIRHPETLRAEDEETDMWPLTYIRSRVSSTGTASSHLPGFGAADNIDILVEAYNRIYGSPGRPPAVQRAGSNRLLLHGSRETVTDIKRSLAFVDAPWPQVQLNLWAIQVSGSAEKVADRIGKISREIRTTQDQMAGVQQKLTQLAAEKQDECDTRKIENHFRIAGIDLNPRGPLSLNESLVLLLIRQNRQEKVGKLRQFVESAGLARPEQKAFRRLERVLAQETFLTDQAGFLDFRDALACFKNQSRRVDRPEAPSKIVRTGATVDRLLKSAMEAFATDMDEIFLEPLLVRIQAYAPPDRRDDGIALVGKSRIVVTSGLEAGLTPEMASFAETTRPKPFGREVLDLAFPASESGSGADGWMSTDVPLAGAERILAGLPQAQAMLLAAALLTETEPTYSKVAPGIAINARPTVLPDGGSARLTIDARFGVASEPLDATERTDVWAQAPPAGISSHHIRTDTNVSAFDLFEISSFSVAASHPQAPFYVPILGRLPVIGRAFQIPRRNKNVHFESLVLVNTVILPRALQLNRFYESPSQEDPEEVKCPEVSWRSRVRSPGAE